MSVLDITVGVLVAVLIIGTAYAVEWMLWNRKYVWKPNNGMGARANVRRNVSEHAYAARMASFRKDV